MAQVTATLSNYRQAPRKVRLVANLVKGKSLAAAMAELAFLPKRAGGPMKTLIMSAVANAKNIGVETENLFIKEIRVDKGVVLKRSMPRARGRAFPINKRTSHILVILGTEGAKKTKKELRTANKLAKKNV